MIWIGTKVWIVEFYLLRQGYAPYDPEPEPENELEHVHDSAIELGSEPQSKELEQQLVSDPDPKSESMPAPTLVASLEYVKLSNVIPKQHTPHQLTQRTDPFLPLLHDVADLCFIYSLPYYNDNDVFVVQLSTPHGSCRSSSSTATRSAP